MIATVLKDRILLADGRSVIDAGDTLNMILYGLSTNQFLVSEITPEINLFNSLAEDTIKVFNEEEPQLDFTWLIPESYLNLDLKEYFTKISCHPRVYEELEQVNKYGFENGLRTIIYVVDKLKEEKVLWGIGRGSSCASYLLYLLGLHRVDPIKYDIPFTEFFHD
jgi:DNA polymerase III alpha subunit